jgi:hypothetical protein
MLHENPPFESRPLKRRGPHMAADNHLRPPRQQHGRQPLVEVVRLVLIDERKDLRRLKGKFEWDCLASVASK